MQKHSFLTDSAAPLFSQPKVYAMALGGALEPCGIPAGIALRLENAAHHAGVARGEILASERELTDFFGTSRDTLRQAIRIVEQRGSMRMIRGRYGGLSVERPDARRVGVAMAIYLRASGCTIEDTGRAADLIDPLLVCSATRAGFPQAESRKVNDRDRLAEWVPEPGLKLYAATMGAMTDAVSAIAGSSSAAGNMPSVLLAAVHQSHPGGTDAPVAHPGRCDFGDTGAPATRWDVGEARGAQIATALLHRMFAFDLKSGARLGAEWELACALDTSREVIRQGLGLLADIDMLRPQRGRGGGFIVKRPSPAGIVRQVHPFLAVTDALPPPMIDLVGELNIVHLKLAANRLAEMPRPARKEALRALVAFGRDGNPDETFIRIFEEIGRVAANPLVDTLLRCLVACQARAYAPPQPTNVSAWARIYGHHRAVVRALECADAETAEYHVREMHRHLSDPSN